MPRETTEIRIDEHGDETHESWILLTASRASTTRQWLFDSDIAHQHFVAVKVSRCTRRRDLNHDWIHATERLLEMAMSLAQWGAFVSSFGQGGGVPATLEFLTGVGHVPSAPAESRFDESHQEVREAGSRALSRVAEQYAAVVEAFEAGGKRALREELRSLGHAIENAPKNMEFAASSLTEHVESVVAKARADIEAMAMAATERGTLAEPASALALESGVLPKETP